MNDGVVEMICLEVSIDEWLKMGHRENVANDEQLDPYFELFDN